MEIDEGYLGAFYKFRFTLPDRELFPKFDDCLMRLLEVLDIREGGKAKWWSIGYEELNGCGEMTKPHFHIHFASMHREATLRKRLQTLFKKDEFSEWTLGLKGNRLYSLCCVDDEEGGVKDLNRFFRYPLKQLCEQHRAFEINPNYQCLPDDFDIKVQSLIAHDEWSRDVEFKVKKKQQLEQPSTKDKLFEYLDSCAVEQRATKRSLLILIIAYYDREEKSANKQTILGYLQTALWRYKLETHEATADKWLAQI